MKTIFSWSEHQEPRAHENGAEIRSFTSPHTPGKVEEGREACVHQGNCQVTTLHFHGGGVLAKKKNA